MKKTLMLVAVMMLLTLAACGKQSVEQATNDFCASLQTYGQALTGLENLTPDSTVKEFDSARKTAEQAREDVVKSAQDMHEAKMDAINQAWSDLDKTIGSISGKDTLGEAASQITQSAATVRAAFDELGRGNCPEQFAQAPANAPAPVQPITSTGSVSGTAPISVTAALTATAGVTVSAPITAAQAVTVTAQTAPAGTYMATLPAADTAGRIMTLTVNPDGTVTMSTDYMNGQPPVVESGTWQANGDGTFTVTFTEVDGNTLATPDVITFSAQDGVLQAVAYDQQVYGEAGLLMQTSSIPPPAAAEVTTETVAASAATAPATAAAPAATAAAPATPAAAPATPQLTGTTWQLQSIQRGDGSTSTPDDPAQYTLTMQPDGSAHVVADCKTGKGTYKTSGSKISFSLGYTGPVCPAPTMSQQYMQYLDYANAYSLTGDTLVIEYSNGDGAMTFSPAEP